MLWNTDYVCVWLRNVILQNNVGLFPHNCQIKYMFFLLLFVFNRMWRTMIFTHIVIFLLRHLLCIHRFCRSAGWKVPPLYKNSIYKQSLLNANQMKTLVAIFVHKQSPFYFPFCKIVTEVLHSTPVSYILRWAPLST